MRCWNLLGCSKARPLRTPKNKNGTAGIQFDRLFRQAVTEPVADGCREADSRDSQKLQTSGHSVRSLRLPSVAEAASGCKDSSVWGPYLRLSTRAARREARAAGEAMLSHKTQEEEDLALDPFL